MLIPGGEAGGSGGLDVMTIPAMRVANGVVAYNAVYHFGISDGQKWVASTGGPASGVQNFIPFIPGRSGTISNIWFQLASQPYAGTKKIGFAIYSDLGGYPGSKLSAASLDVSQNDTGVKQVAINQAVTKDKLYWLGFARSNSTGSITFITMQNPVEYMMGAPTSPQSSWATPRNGVSVSSGWNADSDWYTPVGFAGSTVDFSGNQPLFGYEFSS